jgi:hypothetical protein
MKVEELQAVLNAKGIRARSYSLDGSDQNERYCLERVRGGWALFDSERGERNDERWFEAEDAACDYLLPIIMEDPATRRR